MVAVSGTLKFPKLVASTAGGQFATPAVSWTSISAVHIFI